MILPDIRLLLLAFWLGAALSVCFALSEAVRLLFSLRKLTVFVSDILFCGLCTVCTFLLALSGTNGRLRLYWFIFEAAGFFCVHVTFTYVLRRCAEKLRLFSERMTLKRRIKMEKRKESNTGFPGFFRKTHEKNEKKT